jgi:hypothetical protein
MAILTNSGRAALAAAVKAQSLHLALGSGDPAWDAGDRPPEDAAATTLLAEVGRRTVDEAAYVVADAAGTIIAPTGRYTLSAAPTNHLFIRVAFDMADAATATIREQGLFVGTVAAEGLPPGLRYFEPGQIADPGILLLLQRSVPIIRQPTTRETFEFVLTL